MAKQLQLLLTETIEGLGIVGDVVRVRGGYARNYLLPRGLGTEPSEEAVAALAEKRRLAEQELQRRRVAREKMAEQLQSFEVTLERSCNEQGQLYGSVTQKDIAEALSAEGFEVTPRDVRLPHAIKRIDSYEIPLRLDADLEATVKLWVVPDRELQTEDRVEMEFDEEGNLIERPQAASTAPEAEQPEPAGDVGAAAG